MSEPTATLRKNVSESLRAAELVEAKPNLCWENASNVVLHDEFPGAIYVEGAVISRQTGFPQEHGWVVFNGEIIDPTLPERELFYFPAHQWTGEAFTDVLFKYEDKPYFKHSEFKVNAVQVEMDKARAAAAALAVTWK